MLIHCGCFEVWLYTAQSCNFRREAVWLFRPGVPKLFYSCTTKKFVLTSHNLGFIITN